LKAKDFRQIAPQIESVIKWSGRIRLLIDASGFTTSMIRDARPVTLKVTGDAGTLSSRQAESIGLITTELVMNSLKHAFPTPGAKGQIAISYEVEGTDWELTVADNGIGKQDGIFAQSKTGLGTGIVGALAQTLDARVETLSGAGGTTISVTHATFSKAGARSGSAAAGP
jgi:chemotaxis protein methyltransferase CheR